jgi:uncharacterized membrane protein
MKAIAFYSICALLTGLVSAGSAFSQSVDFQGLGALPGATGGGSLGGDLSADGSVVVGGGSSTAAVHEAWRWTSAAGMHGLGFLPGASTSSAQVVSANGQFIAGASGSDAFRWSSGSGFETIDDGMFTTVVVGISNDGGTIVGTGHTLQLPAFEFEVWRWRSGLGIDLAISGDIFSWTTFYDVSADGQTILASADIFDDSTPYLRTDTGNTYLTIEFPIHYCQCGDPPSAMSPDAAVVVGSYNSTQAYRWDVQLGGGQLLGFLDLGGATPSSAARDVSSDGSIIVGESADDQSQSAFIWSHAGGMQEISEILSRNGIDLGAWQLNSAVAISDDGTVILGNGINPSGAPEAWLAVIPASALSLYPVPSLGGMAVLLLTCLLLSTGVVAARGAARRPYAAS